MFVSNFPIVGVKDVGRAQKSDKGAIKSLSSKHALTRGGAKDNYHAISPPF